MNVLLSCMEFPIPKILLCYFVEVLLNASSPENMGEDEKCA